jgi:Na+/H+-dicarboxylate symporter
VPGFLSFLKRWRFTLILLSAVATGAAAGLGLGEKAQVLKPLGDVFLNLLFTAVIPLVFFSLSSAVAGMTELKRLGRILGWMILVFVATGVISACLMLGAVKLFDPAAGLTITLPPAQPTESVSVAQQVVKMVSVSSFADLLDRRNMPALIVISLLTGLAASLAGQKGRAFAEFLKSGAEVMARLVGLIMLYAPVGLGAYFAYLTGRFGPGLIGSYGRAVALYYPVAILYFAVFFSLYVFMAAGRDGLKRFWTNIPAPALTAWATGSSIAAIPANLQACRRIGVPDQISEIVLPTGATIHMDGSCLSAILKIALLFGLFGKDFSGADVMIKAVGIALVSGTVMGGIPGGGFLGEMMIVTLYGFPPEALPVISTLGMLIDPPATMVNSCGDTVASMLVARAVFGKKSAQRRQLS